MIWTKLNKQEEKIKEIKISEDKNALMVFYVDNSYNLFERVDPVKIKKRKVRNRW